MFRIDAMLNLYTIYRYGYHLSLTKLHVTCSLVHLQISCNRHTVLSHSTIYITKLASLQVRAIAMLLLRTVWNWKRICSWDPLQWSNVRTKFLENRSICSKVYTKKHINLAILHGIIRII